MQVKWIRSSLVGDQMDGGYEESDFELVVEASPQTTWGNITLSSIDEIDCTAEYYEEVLKPKKTFMKNINGNLELTYEGEQALKLINFIEKKDEMVKMAEVVIAESEKNK